MPGAEDTNDATRAKYVRMREAGILDDWEYESLMKALEARATKQLIELQSAFIEGRITEAMYHKMAAPMENIVNQSTSGCDTGRYAPHASGGDGSPTASSGDRMDSIIGRLGVSSAKLICGVGLRPLSFRVVDIVGYVGAAADKYFGICDKYYGYRSGEKPVQKEDMPLLCTVGVGGQGKTELCYEVLRTLEQRAVDFSETQGICAVMVTFSQGNDWMVNTTFRHWDEQSIILGLWARIGNVMGIRDWEKFKPQSMSEIFEVLHAITKKRSPKVDAIEVHLLIDETLKITDDEQRRRLLDELGAEVQKSIASRSQQKSFALVTSLRAVSIDEDLAKSGTNRAVRYIPLAPPTHVKRKIALALLVQVMLDLQKKILSSNREHHRDRFGFSLAGRDHSSLRAVLSECWPSNGDQQLPGPSVCKQQVMDSIRKHSSTRTADAFPVLEKCFLAAKAAVYHAVYTAGTWRSLEYYFTAAAEQKFLTNLLENPTGVPRVGDGGADSHYCSFEDDASHLAACTRQMMKLCANWEAVIANRMPEDVEVSETEFQRQLKGKTMWMYERSETSPDHCVPFVTLRFVQQATDQGSLNDIEKLFHTTYRELSRRLMVENVDKLSKAFEDAVILALGLKLLALNRKYDDSSAGSISATLGELIPNAQFSSEELKDIRLERTVSSEAFLLKPLPKAAARTQEGGGAAVANAIVESCDFSVLAADRSNTGSASGKAIGGAMTLQRDTASGPKTVIGAYGMKLRDNDFATSVFASVIDLMNDSTGEFIAIVASPETQVDFSNAATKDCVFIGYDALEMLLGPFGASYLLTLVVD